MRGVLFGLASLVAAVPAVAQESGWIGVSIEDQKDRGAIIRRVEPNSPADKAGLKEGDVIIEFNRQEVMGVQQLTRLVRETPVGRTRHGPEADAALQPTMCGCTRINVMLVLRVVRSYT